MCQLREKHTFGDLPVQDGHEKLLSGLVVIDLSAGKFVRLFKFTAGCTEIYDVQFLVRVRNRNVVNLTDNSELLPKVVFVEG